MTFSFLFSCMLISSVICSILTGSGSALAAAIPEGAQAAVELAVSLTGVICLWSGLSRVMETIGATKLLSRLFHPLFCLLFPDACREEETIGAISANFTANLLGLGNAATPLGLVAVKKLAKKAKDGTPTHEMCRFIVLNTASVQLLPVTVAALRASHGAANAFDILPCVWLTSVCALAVGEGAAFLFARRP